MFLYTASFSFLTVIRTEKLKADSESACQRFSTSAFLASILENRRVRYTLRPGTRLVPIRSGGVTAKGNSKSAPLLLPVPRPSHGRKSTRQERNCSWLPARVEASSWRDLGAIFRSAPPPPKDRGSGGQFLPLLPVSSPESALFAASLSLSLRTSFPTLLRRSFRLGVCLFSPSSPLSNTASRDIPTTLG